MEDFLSHVKEISLKLGECGKNYHKNDLKIIELVVMNLRTFDVFMYTFKAKYKALKEDGMDYTFESLYGLLITYQHRLLKEGKLGRKHWAHLLKGKRKKPSFP